MIVRKTSLTDEVPMITVDATAKKPIGVWSLISSVAAIATGMLLELRTIGVG